MKQQLLSMTLLFGTQFVVLEAYHLLFWNSCILMPFFSVSSTCAKTWNLVHLSRFVFNGYSGHVWYSCCSYARSVRVSGWWTYSQTWFHPSFYVFHFDERHHDLHFHLMAVPPTNFHWFPGTDEQGLSLEAPWKVIIGHDRPPLYLGMGWITVDDWTGNSRLAGAGGFHRSLNAMNTDSTRRCLFFYFRPRKKWKHLKRWTSKIWVPIHISIMFFLKIRPSKDCSTFARYQRPRGWMVIWNAKTLSRWAWFQKAL